MPMPASLRPRRPSPPACATSLAFVALLACAPPPLPEADTGIGAPSIRITWPPPESPIQGCETVAVDVENFTLVDFATASEVVEGEGHYHIEHPGGYAACYKPYCFVDFSEVAGTTEPFLTAILADSQHNDVLDENGDPYMHRIPIEFVPGDCTVADGDTGAG